MKDNTPGTLGGSGTEEDAYLIQSIEDLVAFSEDVNSGNTYEGKTVKLVQLLDFNSNNSYASEDPAELKATLTTGEGFTPIGTDDNPFKGIFDGDGTEIRNIHINLPTNSAIQEVGLFGVTVDATIKNVGVTGKLVAKDSTGAAGIASSMYAETKEAKILNCYNEVDLDHASSGGGSLGGIISYAVGTEEFNVIIQDCYNIGTVKGQGGTAGGYTGGIVGLAESNTVINRCYNLGDVSGSVETAGIVGQADITTIINVYNEGKIFGEQAAGIVGRTEHGCIIRNAYNVGDIKTTLNNSVGIVNYVSTTASLENCYNLGEVENAEIIGNAAEGITYTNVYYVSGRKPAIGDETITSTTTEITLNEMQSQAFVDELNENIKDMPECVKWKLGTNGYPVLDM